MTALQLTDSEIETIVLAHRDKLASLKKERESIDSQIAQREARLADLLSASVDHALVEIAPSDTSTPQPLAMAKGGKRRIKGVSETVIKQFATANVGKSFPTTKVAELTSTSYATARRLLKDVLQVKESPPGVWNF